MTDVKFYKIKGGVENVLLLACQLAEKAVGQNMRVLLNTNTDHAEQLSQLLWSFKPSAFLPHTDDLGSEHTVEIVITTSNDPGEHHGVLVNLQPETPTWFSRFEKTIEIIYDDQQIMEKKRDAFRYYKSRGYPLQYHDLSKVT